MMLEPGTKLGRYEIRSQIGAGGMGEVYLAQDTMLDRKVALKILPADLAANQDRMRRFIQEAKAAAALNHPNIAHIYEIGKSDGTNFIAMEFVDGQTLREKIHGEQSQLKVVLEHLLQVAEGLAKAHASGIVHRDLKPDNIMITREGHAKILDFGLAKLVETKPDGAAEVGEAATAMMPVQHSTPGVVMGTVGYMSPEQAQAKPVDQRSDIFSFGCLLYEAATGRQPFAGDSVVDTLHKIIHDPAPAITDFNPSASPELQRVIRKCLAKESEKRYQTIRDTANDLEELLDEMKGPSDIERSVAPSTSATTSSAMSSTDDVRAESAASVSRQPASSAEYVVTGIKQHRLALVIALLLLIGGAVGVGLYLRARNRGLAIESIAVMPFVNESGNADVEYLSDGMTETLISSLSNLPNLNVKPRSSVFRYKGTETNSQTIGKELNVQAILNGRIVQRGQDVSLYVELIDIALDRVVWSQQYKRKQSDLVTLQADIARDVSSRIKTKLSSADEAKVTKTYTTNSEAYQLYLKGKYYANKFTKEGFRQSIDSFNQAIALDPNYSSAYSGLAYAYILLDDWFEPPRESAPKARETAQKALLINEEDVDAHVVLGMVAHWYDWDWATAEREFKRSLEINPKNTDSYTYYSFFLAAMKRDDEARAIALQGLQVDPLSSGMNFGMGATLVFSHRWDAAIVHYRKAIELDPNFWLHHSYLGRSYEQKAMMPEAIAEFKLALELDDQQSENWAGLGHAYAVSGNKAEAQKMIDEMIKRSSQNIYVAPYNVAVIYAGLGDKDKALEWLERAYSDRAYYLPVYLTTDARLDSPHSDPRYKDLLKRMNLPE
ncbi:MAG: eukaryotic-like serine/threonine-protein kinase [Blastocatellia bacterium]|nr:eukaryotic-like serine/threonine-protein kinase [Blastocatellia bacterium]